MTQETQVEDRLPAPAWLPVDDTCPTCGRGFSEGEFIGCHKWACPMHHRDYWEYPRMWL